MKYNRLGQQRPVTFRICASAPGLFGPQLFRRRHRHPGPEGSHQPDRPGLEARVNFIDTANVYSFGNSEMMTGQALKDLGVKRSDVVLATKVFGRMAPGPNDIGASRGHIMDGVARSLERLQTDHIDLYQIHQSDTRHRRWKRPCGRWTIWCARAWCVMSASPTGKPGRS